MSRFDTSNVTDMQNMFNSSTAKYIDVSNFNIDNIYDLSTISGMFANMKDIEELDISNLNFTHIDVGTLKDLRIFNGSSFKKIYVKDQNNLNFLQEYSKNVVLPLHIK